MLIRKYEEDDAKRLTEIFFETVHGINKKDYTKDQLDVWAPKDLDIDVFNEKFSKSYTIVVTCNEQIIGFGNLVNRELIDMLFVDKDHQRKGVATLICNHLENIAKGNVFVDASITAKPFFENRGYEVLNEQTVERTGITLINYKMKLYV